MDKGSSAECYYAKRCIEVTKKHHLAVFIGTLLALKSAKSRAVCAIIGRGEARAD
jgi:hypothetical protein